MPDASAATPLTEALAHLTAHGIVVTLDRIDGAWRYVMDGAATTEGEIVARAVMLGMLASGRVQ